MIQANDPFCLIFTSGTTGLPKAAPYTHQAALKSCTMKMMVGMKPGEVCYSALPLYHTFASQVGVTGAIIAGAAVAFAPKFSASKFWSDSKGPHNSITLRFLSYHMYDNSR